MLLIMLDKDDDVCGWDIVGRWIRHLGAWMENGLIKIKAFGRQGSLESCECSEVSDHGVIS